MKLFQRGQKANMALLFSTIGCFQVFQLNPRQLPTIYCLLVLLPSRCSCGKSNKVVIWPLFLCCRSWGCSRIP